MIQIGLDDPAIETIAQAVRAARKAVVVTGAGVSCNAGIPDFRSENGLYNLVKQQYPDAVVKGKDLFDTILFRDPETVRIFYTFMASLRKAMLDSHPTPTHHLIKHLRDKKRLLRCYTQNIDGLEQNVGLSVGYTNLKELEVVQLHGDIHSLKCSSCKFECKWTAEYADNLFHGTAPECPTCQETEQLRTLAGRRPRPTGFLRPNVVLYGEEHPHGDMIGQCTAKDQRARPDLLVVAGTSLKVVGIRHLVKDLAKAVKERGGMVVFVNQSPVSSSLWDNVFDYHIKADTDAWAQDLRTRIPTFFKKQTKLKVSVSKLPSHMDPATPKGKDQGKRVLSSEAKPAKRTKSADYVSEEKYNDLAASSPESFSTFQASPQHAEPPKMEDPQLMGKCPNSTFEAPTPLKPLKTSPGNSPIYSASHPVPQPALQPVPHPVPLPVPSLHMQMYGFQPIQPVFGQFQPAPAVRTGSGVFRFGPEWKQVFE